MIKVFISCAAEDQDIADAFIAIILKDSFQMQIEEIFCSGTENQNFKSAKEWRAEIRGVLASAEITFLIITPNFKESEICLNEMGAAFVLSPVVFPILVEPITFDKIGIIPELDQVKMLLNEHHLDYLKERVQEILEISENIHSGYKWYENKHRFIKRVKRHIENNPFNVTMDRELFDEALSNETWLNETIETLNDEKDNLEKQIREFWNAQDRHDVLSIKMKYDPATEFTSFAEFKRLCASVKDALRGIKPIIVGIIFNSYLNKHIKIDFEGYESDIDQAVAENYIIVNKESGTVDAVWNTNRRMKFIHRTISSVDSFINDELKEIFYKEYDENFLAPLKMDNKLFWEEVFKVKILFN